MSILSKLVNRKKEENQEKQVKQVNKRSFLAATNTRLQNWVMSYQRINGQLVLDAKRMIMKARQLAKNNDFVIGYLNLLQRNIIGYNGYRLKMMAVNTDGTLDAVGNEIIQQLYDEYMRKGNVSPIMTGRDLDVLILRTLVVDGEVFIRKVKDNSKFGIHYQLIDTLDIDHMYNTLTYDSQGNRIIMGIKVDQSYKPISYFINKVKGDYYNTSAARQQISADEIIHIYRPYFVGQVRGYTMLSSVILNLNQLDGYTEAEVVGARLAACNQAFITQTTADGDLLEQANERGELIQDYAPGTIRYLPNGYDIKAFNSTHPNSNYGQFVKSVLRSISNALGISYNKANSDYESVNYSSLRESQLQDRMTYKELQYFLTEAYKDEQFKDFLKQVLVNQMTILPLARFDKFLRHEWKLNQWEWVDPIKEYNAIKTKLELKLTDPITEIQKLGGDPYAVLNRWKLWNDKKKQLGIAESVDDSSIIETAIIQDDIDNEN